MTSQSTISPLRLSVELPTPTDSAPSTPSKPHFINPFTAQWTKRISSGMSDIPPKPYSDCLSPIAPLAGAVSAYSSNSCHLCFQTSLFSYTFGWMVKKRRHVAGIFTIVGALVLLCFLATSHARPSYRRVTRSLSQHPLTADSRQFAPGRLRFSGRPYSPMMDIPVTERQKWDEEIVMTPTQELGTLVSFMAANAVNVLPETVDPSEPLEPQLVVDFDTRFSGAQEEVDALVQDTWSNYPVVILSQLHSPVARDLKAVISSYHLFPRPLIWEVDARADKHVIVPTLMRLTNSTDLPILLVGGQTIGLSTDPSAETDINSARKILSRVQDMQKSGELEHLLRDAGAIIDGSARKKKQT